MNLETLPPVLKRRSFLRYLLWLQLYTKEHDRKTYYDFWQSPQRPLTKEEEEEIQEDEEAKDNQELFQHHRMYRSLNNHHQDYRFEFIML